MSPEQQLEYLREQVLPRLSEGGMEAFMIIGYLRLADGTLQRTCLVNTGNNPAYEDGLRGPIQVAHIWGSAPQSFVPPPAEGKQPE